MHVGVAFSMSMHPRAAIAYKELEPEVDKDRFIYAAIAPIPAFSTSI